MAGKLWTETRDRVSVLGWLIGCTSFYLSNHVMIRPNRILAGTYLNAMALAGPLTWLFAFAWGLLLFLILIKTDNLKLNMAAGAGSGLLFCFYLMLLSRVDGSILGGGFPFYRISLGTGFWLMFLSWYIILFGCRMQLKNHPAAGVVITAIVPLAIIFMFASGRFQNLSIYMEYLNRKETFLKEFQQHLFLALGAVVSGVIVGILLGLGVFRRWFSEQGVFLFVNLSQTIPTLSLLALLLIPLTMLSQRFPILQQLGIRGVGWAPAVIVLFLYSLLPITRNTLAGFQVVSKEDLDTAKAVGMSSRQVFWRVELPLAFPVILSGIRTALTQTIGNTILAGLVGAGGLGSIIFLGLAQAAPDLILLGALPVVILAWITDQGMMLLIQKTTPKGVIYTHDHP
jgi:osmoprotectant transport system permease protein